MFCPNIGFPYFIPCLMYSQGLEARIFPLQELP